MDELIKWIAESDPIVRMPDYLDDYCFFCGVTGYDAEVPRLNEFDWPHADDCRYVWACEQVSKPEDVIKSIVGPGGETL